MPDTLRIRNMVFHAYHGLLPEETRLGQRFEVDLELQMDLRAAGKADDPALTVDYAGAYALVAQIVTGPPFGLVEALAEAIAAAVGERYNAVESVLVRVRKPNPPVEGQFDGLEIQIERRIGR